MTAQKHTDGPWVFEDYSQEEPEFFVVPATYYGTVAKVYLEEDARLIAAAPEMLDVLKAAIANSDANVGPYGRTPEAQAVYDQVSDAIAKATGQ